MQFRKITIDDRKLITGYVNNSNCMGCEFAFANILLWSDYYKTEFCEINDTLVFCTSYEENSKKYMKFSFPLGNGDVKDLKNTITYMMKYASEKDAEFELKGLCDENIKQLQNLFPNIFEYMEDRDSYDYIYNSEDLITLKGKKYHQKRNHINRFKKENDFQYEKMDKHNVSDCLAMLETWIKLNLDENSDDTKTAEIVVVRKMCEHLDELELVGGLLRVDGEVVAFTIGEKLSDETFVVHIEKAFADINGCYTMINQQFCMNELTEYKYINREEDLGLEGLRKAKLSYYPEILLKKDIAVIKNKDMRI